MTQAQTAAKANPLHVIIVGAGLGGLAAAIATREAGHNVTICEQAPALGEVGAGIQIPPNSARILERFGLGEEIKKLSVLPHAFIIRSYKGQELNRQPMLPYCQDTYNAPYLHIHRADFHSVLVKKAEDCGVKIKLDAHVNHIDFSAPSVSLANGETLKADLVIAADGLKSKCRELYVGHADPPHNTGDLAYRILVKASDMRKDPDLAKLTEVPMINYWMGPGSHAVCYLLKGGEVYNIVLCCPDNLPDDVNIAPAAPGELDAFFATWDRRLQKLLALSHDVSKWRLQNSREMETWVHPAGKFTLLGDSCHATLPYLAQGAAMAVEDGAAIGNLLGKIQSKDQLGDVLKMYENARKKRTETVVKASTHQRDVFHLEDGEAQKKRDGVLLADQPKPGFPNKWRDSEFRDWLFGYNVFDEVDKAWERYQKEGKYWEKGEVDASVPASNGPGVHVEMIV